MADFSAHIKQAVHNCEILKSLNSVVPNSWDWQLTTAFYVAVHLVNAHMAKVANLHYKTHVDVKNALYSHETIKLPNHVYLAYVKLESLSRRARYLCSEKQTLSKDTGTHLTYELHFAKAIRHLDIVMRYMNETHKLEFSKHDLDCLELKNDKLHHFNYKPKAA